MSPPFKNSVAKSENIDRLKGIVDSAYSRLLFVVNSDKTNADELAFRLSKIAGDAGFDSKISGLYPVNDKAFANADVCCVIGGDGTILACVEGAVKYNVPIFGINLGKLGFMATFTDDITKAGFLSIIKGKGETEKRTLLEASSNGNKIMALNEIVIKSPDPTGITSLSVSANGEFVADFVGDGLIFSTPTGSTAYNLSAGGPLIHPEANAFVLTSICSHTLSNRSIIFDSSTKIKVSGKNSVAVVDGKVVKDWDGSGEMCIKLSHESIRFLRPKGHSYFSILRSKLGWADHPALQIKRAK